MVDLLIPVARRLVMNEAAVPMALAGTVSGVVRNSRDAKEIGRAFGRSAKPKKPLMLWGPDNRTVIMIVGDGTAEAAELEDIALAKLEQQEERVRKTGRGVDFNALREKHGLMRREEVDTAVRQAYIDRIRQHQRNSVTDPSRR